MKRYVVEFWGDRRPQFLGFMWLAYIVTTLATGWRSWTLGVAFSGFLLFFLTEYFLHRFLLHGFGKYILPVAYKGHIEHHNDPNHIEYLLTPNLYNIPGHLILWVIFSWAFGGLHWGSVFMWGYITYQLYYEWAHFVSHRPIVPATSFGRYIKKHHLLHHYKKAEGWYGLTHDAFDRIMGTGTEIAGEREVAAAADDKQGLGM